MSDMIPELIITGEQIRAARAMLRLDQRAFAALIHVTLGAVRRMERTRGPIVAAEGVLKALAAALDDAGIILIEPGHYEGVAGPGVRFASEPAPVAEVIDLDQTKAEADPERDEPPAVPDAS